MDLPYNGAACENFGGCPYEQLCDLSPREQLRSIMSQDAQKNAFLAKLQARKAKAKATAPATENETAPAKAKVPKITKAATKKKDDKDARIAELEAEIAALKNKIGPSDELIALCNGDEDIANFIFGVRDELVSILG